MPVPPPVSAPRPFVKFYKITRTNRKTPTYLKIKNKLYIQQDRKLTRVKLNTRKQFEISIVFYMLTIECNKQ